MMSPTARQSSKTTMLAGARPWSSHSAETSSRDLDGAVHERDLRASRADPGLARGGRGPVQAGESVEEHQVIAVFQRPKGGAGCTTLATNLALALRREHPASGPRQRSSAT